MVIDYLAWPLYTRWLFSYLFTPCSYCVFSCCVVQCITLLLSPPGDLTILGGVTITLDSNGVSSQLTFTLISTGGPATTVTWTRNLDIFTLFRGFITEGNKTVLNDQMTSQYTHTLTLTQATTYNGTYSCLVSNKMSSSVGVIVKTTVIFTGYGNAE